MAILVQFIIFIAGLVALIWGAEKLINSASYLASKAGISPLIIGITVLSIGTSLPEIATSIASFTSNHADIAMGNIVGSELVQITVILGIVAFIRPLKGKRKEILFYGISMFVAVLLAYLTILNNIIMWYEGLFLALAYIAYLVYAVQRDKKAYKEEAKEILKKEQSWFKTISFISIGVALTIVGSKLLVGSSIHIAQFFGVSEYIIAVFFVGLGTSLPELAVSGIAAWKKESQMSIGNLLGSNITDPTLSFGLGALFVKSAAINPVAPQSLILLAVVFVLVIGLFAIRKKIGRIEATIIVLLFVASTLFF